MISAGSTEVGANDQARVNQTSDTTIQIKRRVAAGSAGRCIVVLSISG